jgi:hypothetical protein
MTGLGGIMIPIALALYNRPWRLLALVFFYSVFSAAAAIVIGGNGITPGLLPTSLFLMAFTVAVLKGVRYPGERQALVLLTPFMLVVAGALISSVLMPRLFYDQVLVWPQKVDGFFVRSPLAPNSGNYTQDLYLLANALLTITASIYLTRPESRISRLLDCYFFSSLLADAIAFWQFLGNTLHIWYPTDFFLSNPGWAQLSSETVGSLIRLNGSFSEPSSLSAYLCAPVAAAGWLILKGDQRPLLRYVLWFGLSIIALSTSTTGYATLGGLAGILILRLLITGSAQLRRRFFAALIFVTMTAVVGSYLLPVVAPGVADEASLILGSTMTKNQSSSYQERSTSDADSIHEMVQTLGLGVGWGSNRSSSLLPGLCASVGVWGMAGLVWFGVVLFLRLNRVMRPDLDPAQAQTISGASAAVISTVISGLISGPTISSPDFYLLLAILVAAAARPSFAAISENNDRLSTIEGRVTRLCV